MPRAPWIYPAWRCRSSRPGNTVPASVALGLLLRSSRPPPLAAVGTDSYHAPDRPTDSRPLFGGRHASPRRRPDRVARPRPLTPAGLLRREKAPSDAELAKLIDQLGDDDEAVRKEATKKLVALGEAALPALRVAAAKQTADADVRLCPPPWRRPSAGSFSARSTRSKGTRSWACRVLVLPDGKRAVSSGDYLRLWDLESGKEVRHFAPDTYVWGLALSKDGKTGAGEPQRSLRPPLRHRDG